MHAAALLLSLLVLQPEADTVPFELKANLVFLKVSINGGDPRPFVFDTGANVTVLKPETARALGLIAKGEKLGPETVFKTVDSIGMGKAVVKKLPVAILTLPQAEPLAQLGIAYDGILGFNYISQFITTLDYKSKTLKLVPSGFVPDDPRPPADPPRDEPTRVQLGMTYATIGADQANEIGVEGGIVVKAVAADSPAEKGGLKKGDIITEMNGKRIDRAEDYRRLLAKTKPGDVLAFNVIRDKKDVTINVTAEERK